VEDATDDDFVALDTVEDDVSLDDEAATAEIEFVPWRAKFWVIEKRAHRLSEVGAVTTALLDAPALLGVEPNAVEVRPCIWRND
jgi:hypothetical protein